MITISQLPKAVKHVTSDLYFSIEEKNAFKEAKRKIREKLLRGKTMKVKITFEYFKQNEKEIK